MCQDASYSYNNPKVKLMLTQISTDFLMWKPWLTGVTQ